MGKAIAVVLAAGLVSACATPIRPVATGGSRADATVDMSFEFGEFQRPVIDWDQVAADAAKRCASWGYSGAQAFGGANTRCAAPGAYAGCSRQIVTMTYQCTGDGATGPVATE